MRFFRPFYVWFKYNYPKASLTKRRHTFTMSKQSSRSTTDLRKVSGELFTLTYGALVAQLVKDYERDEDVNNQLDKIGYNIGVRLIDDLLAKNSNIGKCNDFREVADVVSKHAFKIYLGVLPTVTNWNAAADEFSLIFDSNPLTEFVELPQADPASSTQPYPSLHYSQAICGAVRGALEMVHMEVVAWFLQDQLRGDPVNEVRVKFIRKLEESVPVGED